ncbi:MAG: glucosyl-3-phosphoglycerate synthase [Acidimicrobiia bacterium]
MNPADLVAAKRTLRHSISVCLPARNEALTVGAVVREVREQLIDSTGRWGGLVDEVVVIDDDSTDPTAEVAAAAGARVVRQADVLAEAGPGSGKGNVLWKSLHACIGDLLCWLDADLRNFRADTVAALLEPLVNDVDTMLVKASYTRSFEGAPTGGGRVTELVARPLVSLLFPKLADIVQPLAGEYAARREAVEVLPFVQGWGVELGLLVDIVERFGRDSVAQVDLGTRVHRNRPVDELAAQSLAILATALRRAGLMQFDGPTLELLRADLEGNIDAELVEIRERPPMTTIPAYRIRHC